MAVMVDKQTRETVPVTAFLNAEQFANDVAAVNDWSRGKWASIIGMALALTRNYNAFRTPKHFRLFDLLRKLDKGLGASGRNYGDVSGSRTVQDIFYRRQDRWNLLFVAGMWFQDLFNYDFRRTEQCIIPYATQEGEISFCAYNTGVGWRNIIEKMHMTATLTKWYEEHGRHQIYAGGKSVALDSVEHHLVLKDDLVTEEEQRDLDVMGIAKNARQEKILERTKRDEKNLRMAQLYREVVLKEPSRPRLVQIATAQAAAPTESKLELVGRNED
jgi:hypothetical protein